MTQEEKQLLLKDLCARLPYRVMIKDTHSGHYGRLVEIGNIFIYFISELNSNTLDAQLCYVKPYLRSMSNMTEEEKKAFNNILPCGMSFGVTYREELILYNDPEYDCDFYFSNYIEIQDWLNARHFDYRGLIPMGLALEAPEGMYKED